MWKNKHHAFTNMEIKVKKKKTNLNSVLNNFNIRSFFFLMRLVINQFTLFGCVEI